MKKTQEKLYIVRKYVWASSARGAIEKEKTQKVDDCWIDDDWRRNNPQDINKQVGFK